MNFVDINKKAKGGQGGLFSKICNIYPPPIFLFLEPYQHNVPKKNTNLCPVHLPRQNIFCPGQNQICPRQNDFIQNKTFFVQDKNFVHGLKRVSPKQK